MRPLVVLRPEPGATATCTAAIELGLRPLAIPLFAIEPLEWAAPDPAGFDGLLLTSANAFRHGGPELDRVRGLPVFAVGKATAAEAHSAGLTVRFTGSGGVDDLLGTIDPRLRLLHLCGEQWRDPETPRPSITHLPVYRAAELPAPDLSAISRAVVAVHSPRAGTRLAALVGELGIDISATALAAISREAASAAGSGWQHVATAEEPNDGALLALAARLCNTWAR